MIKVKVNGNEFPNKFVGMREALFYVLNSGICITANSIVIEKESVVSAVEADAKSGNKTGKNSKDDSGIEKGVE